jgi:transcriptional regulator with XRE-family HTH domain
MQGSLARRLRVLRAERGLTLREAAELTDVRPATLTHIEQGRTRPHDVTLAKIAKGYGVPVDELIEEPVPLGDAPSAKPAGRPQSLPVPPGRDDTLLEGALSAARNDAERQQKATNRLFASQGVLPATYMTDYEEDAFRARLRTLGFPDEYFEDFLWPLVQRALRAEARYEPVLELVDAYATSWEERLSEGTFTLSQAGEFVVFTESIAPVLWRLGRQEKQELPPGREVEGRWGPTISKAIGRLLAISEMLPEDVRKKLEESELTGRRRESEAESTTRERTSNG